MRASLGSQWWAFTSRRAVGSRARDAPATCGRATGVTNIRTTSTRALASRRPDPVSAPRAAVAPPALVARALVPPFSRTLPAALPSVAATLPEPKPLESSPVSPDPVSPVGAGSPVTPRPAPAPVRAPSANLGGGFSMARQLGLSVFLRASHGARHVTAAAGDRVVAARHDQLPATRSSLALRYRRLSGATRNWSRWRRSWPGRKRGW